MTRYHAAVAIVLVAGLATLFFTTRPMDRRTRADATALSGPRQKVVAINEAPRLGVMDARLGVLEFSDFSCPFCAVFAKGTQKALIQRYVDHGKLVWFFKHLPLHESSMGAARLAACAERHQRFWPVHDVLFENQRRFETDRLISYGNAVGLTEEAVRNCVQDEAAGLRVRQDMREASELEVAATPTFLFGEVLDGNMLRVTHRVSGALGRDDFSRIIDSLLVAAKTGR